MERNILSFGDAQRRKQHKQAVRVLSTSKGQLTLHAVDQDDSLTLAVVCTDTAFTEGDSAGPIMLLYAKVDPEKVVGIEFRDCYHHLHFIYEKDTLLLETLLLDMTLWYLGEIEAMAEDERGTSFCDLIDVTKLANDWLWSLHLPAAIPNDFASIVLRLD